MGNGQLRIFYICDSGQESRLKYNKKENFTLGFQHRILDSITKLLKKINNGKFPSKKSKTVTYNKVSFSMYNEITSRLVLWRYIHCRKSVSI